MSPAGLGPRVEANSARGAGLSKNGLGRARRCTLWRPRHDAELTHAVAGPEIAGAIYGTAPPLADTPCVVYVHGNASCRIEALSGCLTTCAILGVACCALDCSGSGHSDGEFISLGLHEADDVKAVVDCLKGNYGLARP